MGENEEWWNWDSRSEKNQALERIRERNPPTPTWDERQKQEEEELGEEWKEVTNKRAMSLGQVSISPHLADMV